MSPILLALFLIALIACVVRYARSRPPLFPPGPLLFPIWGNLFHVLALNYFHPHKALKRLSESYGDPVLGLILGPIRVVVANDYETVREMLEKPEFQGRPDTFLTRVRAYNRRHGIFFTEGDFWAQQRRFSLRHMRDFGFGRRFPKHEEAVMEEVQNMVSALKGNSNNDSSGIAQGRNKVRMPDVFCVGLINSTLEVLFGTRVAVEDNHKALSVANDIVTFQRLGNALGSAVEITPWLRHFWPNLSGWKIFRDNNQTLNDFLRGFMKEQANSFEEEELRGFFDVYFAELKKRQGDGSSFTDRQMMLTIADYFFPAASAVPSALSFAVLFMMRHPDKADLAHKEIAAVVGRDRLPDLNDRAGLPYTEAFLREVLRFTGTPLTTAHRSTEDTYFKGYYVPKGTNLVPNMWAAHRDPTVFENPDEFIPERFLDPATGELKRKDFTVSFGLGKRLCAGETFARQTLFVFLAALLQNYTFAIPPGETMPHQDDMVFGFIFTPKEFWTEVSERP